MKAMVGQSYKFRPVMSYNKHGWLWEAKGWKFKLEWLEIIETPTPKIANQKTGKFIGGKGSRVGIRAYDIETIEPAIGKIMTFTASKTPGHWKMPPPWGYIIPESWIDFEKKAKVLDGSKIPHKSVTWLSSMNKLIGKIVTLKESVNDSVYYVVPRKGAAWYMSKEWLDFDYEKKISEIHEADVQKLKSLAAFMEKKVNSKYDGDLESINNAINEEDKKKWKMLSSAWGAFPIESKVHVTDGS